MEKPLRELLAEYAALLNEAGADSPEAAEFVREYQYNAEFVELADLSRMLKTALTAPAGDATRCAGRSSEN